MLSLSSFFTACAKSIESGPSGESQESPTPAADPQAFALVQGRAADVDIAQRAGIDEGASEDAQLLRQAQREAHLGRADIVEVAAEPSSVS